MDWLLGFNATGNTKAMVPKGIQHVQYDPSFMYGGFGYHPSAWLAPTGSAAGAQPEAESSSKFPASRAPDDPLNDLTDELLRSPVELQRQPSMDQMRQQQLQQVLHEQNPQQHQQPLQQQAQQSGSCTPPVADNRVSFWRSRRCSDSVRIGLAAA